MRHFTFLKQLFLPLLLLTCCSAAAQREHIEWVFQLDGYNYVDADDLEVDEEGNTYVSAHYLGALTIPGLGTKFPGRAHCTGLLLKLDADGKAQWAWSLESANVSQVKQIALMKSGDIVVSGFCDGVTTFPTTSGSALKLGRAREKGEYHNPAYLFVARYSPKGERRWVRVFSVAGGETPALAVNAQDEIHLSAKYSGWLKDGGQTLAEVPKQPGMPDGYSYLRFDAGGKLLEHTPTRYMANIIQFDERGTRIVCGFFRGTASLSPNDSLVADYRSGDAFVARYDAAGKLQWVRKIGGECDQQIMDMATDENGRIYLVGRFSCECLIALGMNLKRSGRYEGPTDHGFFYCRFMPDGRLDFAEYYDSRKRYTIAAHSIARDQNDRIHLLGTFAGAFALGNTDSLKTWHVVPMGFSSTWIGDSAVSLETIADTNRNYFYTSFIRINKDHMALHGWSAHGNDHIIDSKGKKIELTNKDYGRNTFICGGRIPKKTQWKNDSLKMKNHLLDLQLVMECLQPDKAPPSVWYPVEIALKDSTPAAAPANEDIPCGVRIDSCEAKLFPNPTSRSTTLALKGVRGTCHIEVIAANGQLVFSQQVLISGDEQLELDLGGSPAGIYFVNISQNGFRKVLRLVKTN